MAGPESWPAGPRGDPTDRLRALSLSVGRSNGDDQTEGSGLRSSYNERSGRRAGRLRRSNSGLDLRRSGDDRAPPGTGGAKENAEDVTDDPPNRKEYGSHESLDGGDNYSTSGGSSTTSMAPPAAPPSPSPRIRGGGLKSAILKKFRSSGTNPSPPTNNNLGSNASSHSGDDSEWYGSAGGSQTPSIASGNSTSSNQGQSDGNKEGTTPLLGPGVAHHDVRSLCVRWLPPPGSHLDRTSNNTTTGASAAALAAAAELQQQQNSDQQNNNATNNNNNNIVFPKGLDPLGDGRCNRLVAR